MKRFLRVILLLVGLAGLALGGTQLAQAQGSPLHPLFPLLDAAGTNVRESGAPVSTMQTCGACHDSAFIATHSFHADAGLTDLGAPGARSDWLPWEISPGLFGAWDPLTYRTLTPAGDPLLDLGTPDWLRLLGARHVGGGPAMTSRGGQPLLDLPPRRDDPETTGREPLTGAAHAWDWQASGVVEMNCFLCHLPQPNQAARVAALQAGEFAWANTATLAGLGVVDQDGAGWRWLPEAFLVNGDVDPQRIAIQDPSSQVCGACHGVVASTSDLISPAQLLSDGGQSLRTGQLYAGQRIKDSGLNLAGKQDLTRAWDVHAERNLACSDCHHARNNPSAYQSATRPEHLTYDPRRLDLGDYLVRPDHNLARGQAAQSGVAPASKDTMRRCESCHDAAQAHDWLPYADVHLRSLSCESCHIPQLNAPAVTQADWTLITPAGTAQITYRGIDGPVDDVRSLIDGYTPVLLLRADMDGQDKLMPFNLISAFFWVYGDPARPVRIEDLQTALLVGDGYAPEVAAGLDVDGDGVLQPPEMRLDTESKVDLVAQRLAALGLENPRIQGLLQPYNINHAVTNGTYATRTCDTCHREESRLSQPFLVSPYLPGGVLPELDPGANVQLIGDFHVDVDGALYYQPKPQNAGLYLPGHNRVDWIGWIGLGVLLATVVGVAGHGGLRVVEARRLASNHRHTPALQQVYMYTFYERAWHWLQALVILLLMATGIVIHRPDTLGMIDFGLAVPVHNVLAAVLVLNALFSAFYHFASGEIRQYLPEPHGYFSQAIEQIDYYVRGIFRGAPHPFRKSPDHKLNPLQQATYLVILNVLLPLQIVTGLAMWGAQYWPAATGRLGGLPWLAPFHTLVAWLFAAFVVLHIYLTTTGHTPLGNIKAMTTGWDHVEAEPDHPEARPSATPIT